jgi:hypothetical protein
VKLPSKNILGTSSKQRVKPNCNAAFVAASSVSCACTLDAVAAACCSASLDSLLILLAVLLLVVVVDEPQPFVLLLRDLPPAH